MRRNLVGKKLPQQPKLKATSYSTTGYDATTAQATQRKTDRDAATDSLDWADGSYIWEQFATAATNVKPTDHFAFSAVAASLRTSSVFDTTATSTTGDLAERTSSLTVRSRPKYKYTTGSQDGTTSWWFAVSQNSGTVTQNTTDKQVEISWNGSGTGPNFLYQSGPVLGYYRTRVLFKTFTGSGRATLFIDGISTYSFTSSDAGKEVVIYSRAGAGRALKYQLTFENGSVDADLDYFIAEEEDGTGSGSSHLTPETAGPSGLWLGVEAGAETATIDLASHGLTVTSGAGTGPYGDDATSYYTTDGWYGKCFTGIIPVATLWTALRAVNPNLPATVPSDANWYTSLKHETSSATYQLGVQTSIGAGTYTTKDAYACMVQTQTYTTVGVVSAPTWDGNWSRETTAQGGFYRRLDGTTASTWKLDNKDITDFADEPNGFTIEALGIVCGAAVAFELCDKADGEQTASGTIAFRGARGKPIMSDGAGGTQDFSGLTDYNSGYKALTTAVFTNTPTNGEMRAVTFVGESGQDVDFNEIQWDSETGLTPHHSHIACAIHSVN